MDLSRGDGLAFGAEAGGSSAQDDSLNWRFAKMAGFATACVDVVQILKCPFATQGINIVAQGAAVMPQGAA